jgi:glycosyltransferase involved in cell wall biosynthesis
MKAPGNADRPVVLLLDRLFPAIGGMETHGLALRDHLLSAPNGRSVVIWERHPGSLAPETQAPPAEEHPLESVLEQLSTLDGPIVFLNSCHWIEQLGDLRRAAPAGVTVLRTGGNEIFKARHSNSNLVLHERQQFWVEAINRYVDVLLSNSAFSTQRLTDLGVEPGRIRQVRGGFPAGGCAAAARRRSKHRCQLFGPSAGGICVTTCSRLVPFKGINVVIEAVALAQRSHDVSLAVVGDGPLRSDLEAAAVASLRPGSYHFLGPLAPEACLPVIAAGDVYLGLPSELVEKKRQGYYVRTETMGRSFYEAVACGTRIVGTSVGGLPELVSDWNGALVDPGDPEAAAAELLHQAELGRIEAERVRRFRSRFSWQAVFCRYRQWFGL